MASADEMFDNAFASLNTPAAPQESPLSVWQKLGQTWPARMAGDAYSAFQLPGQVYRGEVPIYGEDGRINPDVIKRSTDMAGAVMGGSYAAPAMKSAAGMGVRTLPSDNYLTPLSKYTDKVYRETSPASALEVLPHSNVYGGGGPMGAQRMYYADTPELALGQGTNKGVRVGYDASVFQGQISKEKPGWDHMFEQGAAEYLAYPIKGAKVREAVNSISIDKAALAAAPRPIRMQFDRLINKLKSSEGWEAKDSKEYLDLIRKYGLAGGAVGAATMAGDRAEAAPDFGAQMQNELQAILAP